MDGLLPVVDHVAHAWTADVTRESATLPPEVSELASRLGADSRCERAMVRFDQSGRMRASAGSDWMAFRAKQTMSVIHCAFEWRARTAPLGVVVVRDMLENGEGKQSIKALGLVPMARVDPSTALTRGQLIRYLAELPLAPDAILCNDWLVWRSTSPRTLSVSSGTGDRRAEVSFTLDGDGRVIEVFAEDRPRTVGKGFVPTPWRGRFSDYRLHKGRWLPFAAEVEWEIDGKLDVVWQGRMESWDIR
jgi:hypothetical protein